jgi:hypothetical protein
MRVTFAMLAAASAVFVSAAPTPTDYGNYGGKSRVANLLLHS